MKYQKLSVLLALIMVVSILLCACGPQTPATSDPVSSDGTAVSTSTVAETPTTEAAGTDVPTTEGTEAPTTEAPTTQGTEAPTQAPTTQGTKAPTKAPDKVTSAPKATSTTKKTTTTTTTKAPVTTQSAVTTNLTRDQVIAQMPAKLRGTTIKMMGGDDIREGVWGKAIKEFTQKTGIKLDVEVVSNSELFSTLAARIAAGKSPDLVNVNEAWPFVCANLQPITVSGYNFNDRAWDWDSMNDFTYNGKTYSMQLKNTPFMPVSLLVYNKNALRKADMTDMDPYTIWKNNPDDWTWDKFFSVCDTFLSRNGNAAGYYGAKINHNWYINCFGVNNVYYNKNKGVFVSGMKNKTFIGAWESLLGAMQKKYITNATSTTDFEMGKVLFNWEWPINLQTGNSYYTNLKKSKALGVVPVPTDSKTQPLYWQYGHGIPVGAKNPEAVPYFIRYIQDRKSYDQNTFYSVDTALEVVNWTQTQGYQNRNFFTCLGIHNYSFQTQLQAASPEQVKTVCDKFASEIQKSVDDVNKQMKKLK